MENGKKTQDQAIRIEGIYMHEAGPVVCSHFVETVGPFEDDKASSAWLKQNGFKAVDSGEHRFYIRKAGVFDTDELYYDVKSQMWAEVICSAKINEVQFSSSPAAEAT